MNKLIELIKSGEISVEDLSAAPKIIEKAVLVVKGQEACKKTICFPLGKNTIKWRGPWDAVNDCIEGWAEIAYPCSITFYCENQALGTFNLTDSKEILLSLCEQNQLAFLVYHFLNDQISNANKK